MSRCRIARFTLLLIVSIALTAVNAACWSKVPGPGSSAGGNTELTPQPNDRQEARGELRLPGAQPSSLDPALTQDVSSWGYLLQIYSGLVALDDRLAIVPELASDWTVDPSGKVYTFNLRKDAKFQDGRPITAADFKFSFERVADPKLRSPVADLYLGDVVGVKDKIAGRASDVRGVQVRGDNVLELTIDAPKPYFLAKLTYPTTFVVDRVNVGKGADWWRKPNGSGPFKLKLWQLDEEIVLERNELYYGSKPNLAVVSYFVGGGSALPMYERDELDIAPVGPSDIDRVTEPSNPLSRELAVVPQLNIWYLGFNTRMKPFEDPKVRQAFNLAIDKARIVELVLQKTRVKADGILPPGMPGYSESLKTLSFDAARAKKLLSESTYGGPENLPPITLTTGAGAGSLGQRFTDIYERTLGVRIDVVEVDRGFFEDLNKHMYQMFYVGWVADYPDPQDFLDLLFHSNSSANHTGYASLEVDRLLGEAGVEQDQARRWQLYAEAEQLIVNDAPWVPMFHDVDHLLIKPRVKGLTWTPIGIVSLKDVTVEPRARSGTL